VSTDRQLVEAALPGYELGEELGRGSCGVVLVGEHRRLGRKVAIKELPKAFAADVEVRARFAAEAKLLASFDHPHIVPIYDYVEDNDVCLLVMEYMPGGNVWTRFSNEGLRFEGSIAIALATALALEYAHERDTLHRDIKPDNLLFSRSGAIKVTDFGLAKVMGGAATMVTRTGQILGTPAYIAPEQALAQPITRATDVYSLGVMLFELLSGDLPFADDGNSVRLLMRHVNDEPRDLVAFAPDVPEALAEVVMTAIRKDTGARYPTAWEFAAALATAASHLWGPNWIDRAGVPVDLPDRLASRVSLQAFPPSRAEPVRSSGTLLSEPRQSKRFTSGTGDPALGHDSPNRPEPVADVTVADVVPIKTFLDQSGLQPGDRSAVAPVPLPSHGHGAQHTEPASSQAAGHVSGVVARDPAMPVAARAVAAWYPDPWGVATWRWWDGERWTSSTG